MFKNKYTLLTVALFCVTECALILGELILDLHKVKDVLEAKDATAREFIEELHNIYPSQVPNVDVEITSIYQDILRSTILWMISPPGRNQSDSAKDDYVIDDYNETRRRRSPDDTAVIFVPYTADVNESGHRNVTSPQTAGLGGTAGDVPHSLEENIAHAFHMASITILSILVFETILKALCAGTDFFQRKLETFDLCIVLISFVVDLVCMQIMPRYKIQDFVFILAFLLPWRVIRVVNSLVVAVQDHEHFRLKLIYGRKKKIVNSLRESEIKLQLFRAQCNALKRLCFNEGIDESKIDQILMVEECVVNKAGKSKCKIKIDNSSVILLNDKSDFPRLSPRPSLLNLAADKFGRRKSMLPQCLMGNDRDVCPNSSKDSLTKGILKQRARSNSESGRGTLSSPDDGTANPNTGAEEKYYGGLNTPIIVNRKSSLSSPIMANHVRNILNSLEDKCNQMNGSCSRLGGGRGSIDADSIPEENEERAPKLWDRRVHSIDESPHEGITFNCARRASLQPQKCVDEEDGEVILPAIGSGMSGGFSQRKPCVLLRGDDGPSVIGVPGGGGLPPQHPTRFIIPTTIHIDPPSSNNSNYSLASSSSGSIGGGCGGGGASNKNTSGDQHMQRGNNGTNDTAGQKLAHADSLKPSVPLFMIPQALQNEFQGGQNTLSTSSQETANAHASSCKEIRSPHPVEKGPSGSSVNNLKPKALRTPSDIENENNLTQSESSDICESKSIDDCTRNTSIEEIEDEFEIIESLESISDKDSAVLSGSSVVPNQNATVTPQHIVADPCHDGVESDTLNSQSPISTGSDKSAIEEVNATYRTGGVAATYIVCAAADEDLKSDSTSNLLS